MALLGTGNTLDNHIIGNSLDNVLVGGLGNDILDGGSGNDTANYAASKLAVTVNLLTNTATGGDAAGDTFSNIDNLIGSKLGDTLTGDGNDNILTGGAGNDTLIGGDGNDTFIGSAGNDTLTGGLGNDTFIIASKGDGVDIISGGGGDNDTIQITGTTAIMFAGFNAALLSIENFVGNGLQILGTAGDDTFDLTGLTSGSGVTFLDGGAGNDTLIDNDTFGSDLRGAAGNDTLIGGASDNLLIGGAGNDALNGGGGNDTASYAASKLGVNVNLHLGTGLQGDAAGDTLTDIDNLTGSTKNDIFEGNSGNNILDGGAGVDTVSYAHASGDVTVNIATNTATGWGSDSVLNFENITGSDHNDTLTGNVLANTIIGGAGNDTITTGAGKDVLWIDGNASNIGQDIVMDFTIGQDKLSVSKVDFPNIQALPQPTNDGFGNAVIDFSGGNTITLMNVDADLLTSKDVLFH